MVGWDGRLFGPGGLACAREGLVTSVLRAMFFAAAVNVPAYFIGRLLGMLPLDCSRLDSLFETAIKQIACGG